MTYDGGAHGAFQAIIEAFQSISKEWFVWGLPWSRFELAQFPRIEETYRILEAPNDRAGREYYVLQLVVDGVDRTCALFGQGRSLGDVAEATLPTS
jgi:hypothetical protein